MQNTTAVSARHRAVTSPPTVLEVASRGQRGSKSGRPDLASRHLRVSYSQGVRPQTQFFGIDGAAGIAVVFVFLRNATGNLAFVFAIDVLLASIVFIVTWIMLRRLERPFEALEYTYDSRIKHMLPGLVLLVMVTLAMVRVFGTFEEFGTTLMTGAAALLGWPTTSWLRLGPSLPAPQAE